MQPTTPNSENPQDDFRKPDFWDIDWIKRRQIFCCIYAIGPHSDRGPTKIGYSQNPIKRLLSLQTACWVPITVQEYRFCTSGMNAAMRVERKAHALLRDDGLSMSGEWFNIAPGKAMEVVDFAAQVEGVDISPHPPAKTVQAVRALRALAAQELAPEEHDQFVTRGAFQRAMRR